MNKKIIGLILGIMCLILTYGICVQIKTVNSTNSPISTNTEENNLRNEVLKAKEKYDNKYKELEQAEESLETERKNATENNTELSNLEEQIKSGSKLLGLTEVTGPGVIVTLKDNPSKLLLDPSQGLVHDMDVLSVVNELKNAGAEAISINDNRVVPTTSITCDGNVILINGEKVGTPFIIKAIGLPEQLAALERQGGYLDLLDEYGVITELEKSNNITIPKYTGVINFKYAENVK
jgi:uncharacterized protein YlxW (UPF0749 family)